jgi:hypothetical protein
MYTNANSTCHRIYVSQNKGRTCNEIEMKQETDRRENKDGKDQEEVIFGLQHTDASLWDRELGPS